jgi:hypothetical protein
VLPPPDSRRQRALNEPDELFTRLAISGFGPESRPGDLKSFLFGLFAPALSMTGWLPCGGQRVTLARTSAPGSHGIETEDYSLAVGRGDYFPKPPSNVAGHSRGTTLYGTRT